MVDLDIPVLSFTSGRRRNFESTFPMDEAAVDLRRIMTIYLKSKLPNRFEDLVP